MQKHVIEPGLLQVFRFYAWLRFSVFLLTIIPFIFFLGSLDSLKYASWVTIFTGVNEIILLFYLYLPKREHLLGNWYIPLGIGYATLCLLIEQNLLFAQRGFGQASPFLYILLILVAWQYGFHMVILYTISTVILEIGLSYYLQIPEIIFSGLPNTEIVIAYGSIFARSVTFIIIGFTVNRLVEAQRQQRQALFEANQKLVSHAATLEQLTISRERNRLSRELHDTLAHTLSALAVQLDAVLTTWQDIPEKVKDTLEQMLTTTRTGLNETRRALRALRASPLEELGLANAIRTLAEDVASRGNLALEIHVPENVDDLSPDIEQGFFRVAQESLENVVHHAQASRLSVNLESRDKQIILSISDNGKGIDHRKLPEERGLGIKGMKERAELMGATIQFQSPPQGGTTVILSMEQKT